MYTETNTPLIVVIIIISTLSSLFLPFVMIFVLQDAFSHSIDKWYFAAPFSAYITFMVGILWVPFCLTLYLIIRSKRENRDKRTNKWFFYLLSSISIIICIFAVMNYYYVNDKGLTYHHLFNINESHYVWKDMKEVNQVSASKDGITYTEKVVFVLKNNTEISLPYTTQFRDHRYQIENMLREYGIPFKITPPSP